MTRKRLLLVPAVLAAAFVATWHAPTGSADDVLTGDVNVVDSTWVCSGPVDLFR